MEVTVLSVVVCVIVLLVLVIGAVILMITGTENGNEFITAFGAVALILGVVFVFTVVVPLAGGIEQNDEKKGKCSSVQNQDTYTATISEEEEESIQVTPVEIDGKNYIIVDGKLYEAN